MIGSSPDGNPIENVGRIMTDWTGHRIPHHTTNIIPKVAIQEE